MAGMQRGDRLVMVGDSITDAGRERPVGRAPHGLGCGYVGLVHAMLASERAWSGIEVINLGVGGDTSRDVRQRWHEVLDLGPTWITLMIGVNDVWRQFDRPDAPESAVTLDQYRAFLEEMVISAKDSVKGLCLLTPFYLDPDRSHPMRKMVDTYREAMTGIAHAHGVLHCDTQTMFDRSMDEIPPETLSSDGVHPTLLGHYLLAKHVLTTMQDADWL